MGKKTKRHDEQDALPTAAGDKLASKVYEKELARLHVELVKLQQWVVPGG